MFVISRGYHQLSDLFGKVRGSCYKNNLVFLFCIGIRLWLLYLIYVIALKTPYDYMSTFSNAMFIHFLIWDCIWCFAFNFDLISLLYL